MRGYIIHTYFQGGRKGVILWSQKKVADDADSYAQKITEICDEFPSFNADRQQLSDVLNQQYKDVWPNSKNKRLVLQEMDQISKIYAHSEFVNNLFHDELVRIKDLCLSEFSSPAMASSSASSLAAARPPIELLRGPLKRPERAISKVTATMIVTLCCNYSSDAMQVYRCYKGNFSHLSDTVRCVVVCDSIQHIQAFMITLARHSFTLADKPLSYLDRFLRLFEVFCVLCLPSIHPS
jgi:hypothetical protein